MREPPTKLEFPATVIVDVWQDDSGTWWATSRMMTGLLLVGNTREEVVNKIPGVLADFTSVCLDYDFKPLELKG